MAKKTDIKNDLLDQLERNGVYGNHYIDLVNDYMALWDVKNKLIKDIKEKGVSKTTICNKISKWRIPMGI